MEVGTAVHLRDVLTLDDPRRRDGAGAGRTGDLFAADEAVFQIEVVLVAPPGANSVAVLARRGMPVVRLS